MIDFAHRIWRPVSVGGRPAGSGKKGDALVNSWPGSWPAEQYRIFVELKHSIWPNGRAGAQNLGGKRGKKKRTKSGAILFGGVHMYYGEREREREKKQSLWFDRIRERERERERRIERGQTGGQTGGRMMHIHKHWRLSVGRAQWTLDGSE